MNVKLVEPDGFLALKNPLTQAQTEIKHFIEFHEYVASFIGHLTTISVLRLFSIGSRLLDEYGTREYSGNWHGNQSTRKKPGPIRPTCTTQTGTYSLLGRRAVK
jgi:hypothetical protein